MDMLEHIKARRTIRNFKSDPIPKPILDEIFEAAMWAPSHGNTQPWDFAFVGPQTRAKLLALLKAKADELLADPDLPAPKRKGIEALRDDFGGAPTMLLVTARSGEEPLDKLENPMGAACAVQNMCLAAWAQGIGSVWLSVGAAPPSRAILQVPDDASVVALLALGYPEDIPPAPPRENPEDRIGQLP